MNFTTFHDFEQQIGNGREKQQKMAAFLRSNRVTFTGALLFAVVLPEAVQQSASRIWPSIACPPGRELELFASVFAITLAHVLLRKIGILPLVERKTLIVPAMAVSLGLCLAALLLAVHHVQLFHLVASAILGSAWYYTIYSFDERVGLRRIGVVSARPIEPKLAAMPIEWVRIARPKIHKDLVAIAYDDDITYTPEWESLFSRAVMRKIHFYDLAQLREKLTGRVRIAARPELVFGQLLPSQPYLRIKWAVDVFVALPVLCLVLPVIALVALAIRLESPGPAIYRQKRVGYQGRVFTCYKLRSMRNDVAGPLYTNERDPRITRIGHVIRKYRIDELPQIFNILKGEMSWIGPRPEALRLARAYERAIPHYAYRHTVRPGITGWAAIHQGNVALTDAAAEKLEYDFYYLKYFSIWLDALIVLMTVRTVLTGFGSR
ncbi:sugar transferase [Novosphingobium percolationis]|uniref:sugar transferase n=1 Tax=Novosphingobium percolationis TaxID=2871811 RepID=UPI001CD603B8|nr:sugar transferase [Novosphingobium percolationis]